MATWKKIAFFTDEVEVEEQEVVARLTGGDIDGVTIGIADNNMVQVDGTTNAPINGDYTKWTANGVEGKAASEVKTDLSLNLVENTKHSTDAHTMTIDGVDVSAHAALSLGAHGIPADPAADKYLMWDDVPGELVWATPAGAGDFLADGTVPLTGDIDFAGTQQCHDLQAPAANGEAIRQTAKITEVKLEALDDNALVHADVDDEAVDGETTVPISSNWAFDHNAAILSTTVHSNQNLFSGYGNETITGARTYTKVPALTAITDPLSMLNVADWYGASGAYRQADADSTATTIEDDDANFPNSIRHSVVKWASDAAGTLNTGIGVVANVGTIDADTLTIAKCSGVNFAASYYYWIKHSELVIPVTGIYLVTAAVLFLPAEVDKMYQAQIREISGTDTPVQLTSIVFSTPIATYCQPSGAWLVVLTAGRSIYVAAYHSGTEGTPTLLSGAINYNPLSIFLLQQTA